MQKRKWCAEKRGVLKRSTREKSRMLRGGTAIGMDVSSSADTKTNTNASRTGKEETVDVSAVAECRRASEGDSRTEERTGGTGQVGNEGTVGRTMANNNNGGGFLK